MDKRAITEAKRVLVLGLGRSGMAVVEHLAQAIREGEAFDVLALDESDSEDAEQVAATVRALGLKAYAGATDIDGEWDLAVVSPGIPPGSALRRAAQDSGARIVSELEFAYTESSSTWVAVTGTNGKTTVTSLIAHLLRAAGVPAEAVGNIGTAAVSLVREVGPATILVAEVSSFQLADIDTFHPRVAVLLNITSDHIDWHGSYEGYARDKSRIFDNLTEGDLAVIDIDDPGAAPLAEVVEKRGIQVCRVSVHGSEDADAFVKDGMLVVGTDAIRLVTAKELQILGDHNLANALAASVVALESGADVERVREGLRTFIPIPHRLEPVEWIDGAEYFNDSKATNPDATLKALGAFPDRGIVLLLGGRNKGNVFIDLARHAATVCRAVIVFGEAAQAIERDFGKVDVETMRVEWMSDAVAAAKEMARSGDVVLLSPACASFDEFTGFEDRGCVFRRLVLEMAMHHE